MTPVLLHSPFLGPGSWMEVAPLLSRTCVPDYRPARDARGPWYSHFAQTVAARLPDDDTVLVAHSGAGALVPAVIAALARDVRAVVFADAILPHPGESWLETAPASLAAHLECLSRDGRLPPWNRWWPETVWQGLLPDDALRMEIEAELPEMPLAYLAEHAPDHDLPEALSCIYLQFSAGYDAEAAEAQRRGWPLHALMHGHLAPLTHPCDVAALLQRLL